MAENSSSPILSGVVCSSALSFVASAQPTQSPTENPQVNQKESAIPEQNNQNDRLVPAGLKALYDTCTAVYPDQLNPLQVTTRLKYWLGGHDPLDYISMYWHPGLPEEDVPPHWHYVSFGLSDLHGDSRVHPRVAATSPSGFGMEMTLRLAHSGPPPLWPATLMQALARYVFTTGNKFCAGDHISWHRPLDGAERGRVRHLLVADDPQLPTVDTPHGTVKFLQLVGCTGRELRAAQRGSGFEVLKQMAADPNCSGRLLVTRARRRSSARGVSTALSDVTPPTLAGVSAKVRWERLVTSSAPSPLPDSVQQQIKDTLQRGLSTMSTDRTGPEGHMSTDSFEMSSIERALPHVPSLMEGSWQGENPVEYLDGVHIFLNAEGASLLPLAIDGRVRRGRHFTWREGARALTVLARCVSGAATAPRHPYAAPTPDWLQVEISPELADEMSPQLSRLSRLADTDSESEDEERSERNERTERSEQSERNEQSERLTLPYTLTWQQHNLKITVCHDQQML